MKMERKIGERGQVTLPKDLREQLGFIPDSEVYFSEENGKIVLEKKGESFSEWAENLSGKFGKLDKSIKKYREDQMRQRFE